MTVACVCVCVLSLFARSEIEADWLARMSSCVVVVVVVSFLLCLLYCLCVWMRRRAWFFLLLLLVPVFIYLYINILFFHFWNWVSGVTACRPAGGTHLNSRLLLHSAEELGGVTLSCSRSLIFIIYLFVLLFLNEYFSPWEEVGGCVAVVALSLVALYCIV